MSIVNIHNKSERPFVCTLKDGVTTLRLAIDEIKQVEDTNITDLIYRHEKKGNLILSIVVDKPQTTKKK